jgi:Rrf2 family protein
MKWNISTRLALYAALEMARAGNALVSAAEIAAKYQVSANHLAKVLQNLARVGLVEAVRGVGGGYRLTRPPGEIRLFDIAQIFEGPLELDHCPMSDADCPCPHVHTCRVKRIFAEIVQQALNTLKSVTVAALAGLPETPRTADAGAGPAVSLQTRP